MNNQQISWGFIGTYHGDIITVYNTLSWYYHGDTSFGAIIMGLFSTYDIFDIS